LPLLYLLRRPWLPATGGSACRRSSLLPVPVAGFLAWFIFIGPGVAEFTHLIFPVLQPAIQPELTGPISQAVSSGRFVADMHNYWVKTTGLYYFPGLYTAILPMIPGIYAIRRVVRAAKVPVDFGGSRSSIF
jgi:hypothetical protein